MRDAGAAGGSIEHAWREHHAYLVALAAQVLRNPTEAEDVVQDAFGRLLRADASEVQDVRGWLAVVVRHLCLDRLGSAYARRELVAETGLWEHFAPLHGRPGDGGDPVDRVTLDDQVQLALAIVLDRLTPAERTAFVLHDVFGFPFEVVGTIVGRSAVACRQLASRARRAIRSQEPPALAGVEVAGHQVVAERFIAACAGGDLDQLLAVLDPDVVGEGGFAGQQPRTRVVGRDQVARRVLRFLGPRAGRRLVPVPVEDSTCLVAVDDGRVVGVIMLELADGLVRHMHSFFRRER